MCGRHHLAPPFDGWNPFPALAPEIWLALLALYLHDLLNATTGLAQTVVSLLYFCISLTIIGPAKSYFIIGFFWSSQPYNPHLSLSSISKEMEITTSSQYIAASTSIWFQQPPTPCQFRGFHTSEIRRPSCVVHRVCCCVAPFPLLLDVPFASSCALQSQPQNGNHLRKRDGLTAASGFSRLQSITSEDNAFDSWHRLTDRYMFEVSEEKTCEVHHLEASPTDLFEDKLLTSADAFHFTNAAKSTLYNPAGCDARSSGRLQSFYGRFWAKLQNDT